MSTFRTTVRAIEAAARANGLTRPSMTTLRNVISHALTGRNYSAAVAADRAGSLAPLSRASDLAIATAAERFHLTKRELDALGAALRDLPTRDGTTADADGLTFHLAALLLHPAPLYAPPPASPRPHFAHIELFSDGMVLPGAAGTQDRLTLHALRATRPGDGTFVHEHRNSNSRLYFVAAPSICGRALHAYLLGPGRMLLARVHAGHRVERAGPDQGAVGVLSEDARAAAEAFQKGLDGLPVRRIVPTEQWLSIPGLFADVWPASTSIGRAVQALHSAATDANIVLHGEARLALTRAAFNTFQTAPHTLARVHVETLATLDLITQDALDAWQANPAHRPGVAMTVDPAATPARPSKSASPIPAGAVEARAPQRLFSLLKHRDVSSLVFAERAEILEEALMQGLVALRDAGHIKLSDQAFREYLSLDAYESLAYDARIAYRPDAAAALRAYLRSLPHYRTPEERRTPNAPALLADHAAETLKQHDYAAMYFTQAQQVPVGTRPSKALGEPERNRDVDDKEWTATVAAYKGSNGPLALARYVGAGGEWLVKRHDADSVVAVRLDTHEEAVFDAPTFRAQLLFYPYDETAFYVGAPEAVLAAKLAEHERILAAMRFCMGEQDTPPKLSPPTLSMP